MSRKPMSKEEYKKLAAELLMNLKHERARFDIAIEEAKIVHGEMLAHDPTCVKLCQNLVHARVQPLNELIKHLSSRMEN
jgi:predicted transcriptional regulator